MKTKHTTDSAIVIFIHYLYLVNC